MKEPVKPLTQNPEGEKIETTQAEGTRNPGETEEKVGRTRGQAEGERSGAPEDENIDEAEVISIPTTSKKGKMYDG